jgi:hypothetical protein
MQPSVANLQGQALNAMEAKEQQADEATPLVNAVWPFLGVLGHGS